MMYFIYFILGLLVDAGIVTITGTHGTWSHVVITLFISLIIFAIWGSVLVSLVKDTIEKQREDFFSISRYEKNKESYKAQLEEYKNEMKSDLVDKYREFEETLMAQVKDSKLIAAVLKDCGYANLLSNYNGTVKALINSINECDRSISLRINGMMSRQNDTTWGFGHFIPKSVTYVPREED